MIRYILIYMFLLTAITAQTYRGLVNDGVNFYENKRFTDAEVNFRKGIEKNKKGFEATFNLGDALYKQHRYDESAKYFQNSYANAKDNSHKAKALYNLGNALLKDRKINESINAYKESLKIDPNDKEAKYNLSYVLNLLKKQNQQKNNQDKNQQDKNQQNKDDQKNQNQDNQNKEQNRQQNQKREQNKQQQKLKKDEAQKILDALKRNQKDIQKDIRKKNAQKVYTDKDW